MANKPLTNVDSITTTKEEDLFFVNSDQKVKQVKKSNLKFNYETHVENKPFINNIELSGNKSLDELGIGNKTDIATLNEEMELLAPAIICTASGESIKVDDSAERRMQGFDLHGKTEQTKTNGYQLFDASKLPTKSQGGATVTNNGDGSFTVSGSGNITEQFGIRTDLSHAQTKELLQEGETVTYNKSKSNVTPYFYVQFINETGVIKEFSNTGETSFTITQEILNNPNFVMSYGFYGAGGQSIEPGTIKPMLYQDGDGTWEPFTGGEPSPSPDYSQEIKGIGEEKDGKYSVDVKTIGKNLVATDGDFVTANCIAIDKSTVKSNIVNSMYSNITINDKKYLDFIFKNMGNRINFKCDLSNGTNKTIEIIIYGKRTNGSSYFITTGNNLKASAIIPKDFISLSAVEFRFNRHLENITDKTSVYTNLMAWIGDDDAPFQPYKESLSNIQLDSPLYEGDKIYLEDGELWEYRENAKVVFDGSEDEVWIFDRDELPATMRLCIRVNRSQNIITNPCNKFFLRTHEEYGDYEYIYSNLGSNLIYINIMKSRLKTTDLNGFKEWLKSNPIEVVYKLATPTLKKLGRIEDFGELKTYYPITHITNNEDAEMVVEYVADTKNYVQNEIEKVKNQINNMAAIILNK